MKTEWTDEELFEIWRAQKPLTNEEYARLQTYIVQISSAATQEMTVMSQKMVAFAQSLANVNAEVNRLVNNLNDLAAQSQKRNSLLSTARAFFASKRVRPEEKEVVVLGSMIEPDFYEYTDEELRNMQEERGEDFENE